MTEKRTKKPEIKRGKGKERYEKPDLVKHGVLSIVEGD